RARDVDRDHQPHPPPRAGARRPDRRHAARREGRRRAERRRHPGRADRADRRLQATRRLMRAGAATTEITPPPGLPMLGFVRAQPGATTCGLPLEANALVLEGRDERVVLCNVDTLGLDAPEVDELRSAVADAASARPSAVLLNWNHTHRAP